MTRLSCMFHILGMVFITIQTRGGNGFHDFWLPVWKSFDNFCICYRRYD